MCTSLIIVKLTHKVNHHFYKLRACIKSLELIPFTDKILNSLSLRSGAKQEWSPHHSTQNCTEGPIRCNKVTKKKVKGIQIGKEEVKLTTKSKFNYKM